MVEKNGHVRWVHLVGVLALCLTVAGILIAGQDRRDCGQDRQIEGNAADCKAIPELKTDIRYLKESVDEIKRRLK